MILVTGTKRSGTSLWMQILTAAGLPSFGEAFPGGWKESLSAANPEGFYESSLRHGIYHATNPDPRTGAYFFPEQVERHVVKVFIPGLVRTDRAYIGKVVATMRHPFEFAASLRALYALEDARRETEPPARLPPLLEWWAENYAFIRDLSIRRYATHVETYGQLVTDPERVVREVLAWLGAGDAAAALARVRPELRHHERPEHDGTLDPGDLEVFEALYDTVDRRAPITPALLERVNQVHQRLVPRIVEHETAARRAAARSGS
jgi:hypothetical protein